LFRLSREKALHTVVRGALPVDVLKKMLKHHIPQKLARELAPEAWAGLAVSVLMENPEQGLELAQALHDRLAWDREPADMEEWERLARERPLEALWMGALSETKPVRKAFVRLAPECLRAFRASPQCTPPSWDFTEGILEIHTQTVRDLRDAEKTADDAERKLEAERQRLDDLRGELKQLRRENSELRGEKAQAERRASALAARARPAAAPHDADRIEELERRLRKAEKEAEHLRRELERRDSNGGGGSALPPPGASSAVEVPAMPAPPLSPPPAPQPGDDNPRRRVMRQILRKLFKKGKIGGSHTHEDNVYRGVPDHEKGVAKEVMDLLYREGYLVPKPTATDPHVSLSPERTADVKAILAGEVTNPRLVRYLEGRG
jgi:hypothetical protein